jgi:hypothetical protein
MHAVGGETNLIQQFKVNYAKAKTEKERRTICLEAIDRDVIDRGKPLSTVKEIFGEDFSADIGTGEDGTSYGIVSFSKPIKGGPDASDFFFGWYMTVYYGKGGYIHKYYLTNLHK